jgi:hypothetical protein
MPHVFYTGVDHCINIYLKKIIMKKNMGSTDKFVRLAVAAIVAILYFTGTLTGTMGLVLLILAGVFVLTSLVSICPLYSIFGISTCPVKDGK